MKKKKVLIIVISIVLILSVIGISYAVWTLNLTQTGENDIASTCFNISFTEKDNISLQKSYPLYDKDGKKLTPYEFTITNNCDSYASYVVNLEVLNTTTLTNNDAIKVMFSKKEDNAESGLKLDLLSNYETVTKTLNNATSAFKLITEYLGPNESKTYDLRVWLDENVTTETVNIQNTTFNSKVVVTGRYANELPYEQLIKVRYEKVDGSFEEPITVATKKVYPGDTFTWSVSELDDFKENSSGWEHQWQTPDIEEYVAKDTSEDIIIDIKRQLYYLDLNAVWYYSDGTLFGNTGDLIWGNNTTATADVEINGKIVKKNATDYYDKHRYGSTFRFIITEMPNYKFIGISQGDSQPLSNVSVSENIVTGIIAGERYVSSSYYATTVALKIQELTT